MPNFKKVYTESYRSGFYHPISILILATITLTVAVAIFANSGFFANKNVPTPDQSPQASPVPLPLSNKSTTDETLGWKIYKGKFMQIEFKIPVDWKAEEAQIGSEGEGGKGGPKITVDSNGNSIASFFISENPRGESTPYRKTIKEEQINIDGLTVNVLISTGEFPEDDPPTLRGLMAEVDKNGKKYLIFASYSEGTDEEKIIRNLISTINFI